MADRVEVKLQRNDPDTYYDRSSGRGWFVCSAKLESLAGQSLPNIIWLCAQRTKPRDGIAIQASCSGGRGSQRLRLTSSHRTIPVYSRCENFIRKHFDTDPFYFWVEYK